MKKLGWFTSNNVINDIVIQKDDEMNRFNSDDEATIFVEKSYLKLLKSNEKLLKFLKSEKKSMGIELKSWDKYINDAQKVINEAKGKS